VKGRRRDRLALAPLSELSENSSVPPGGIEPPTRGLGNPVSTAMEYDRETFALVVALHVPRSAQVFGRCWPQGGHNRVSDRAPLAASRWP
jgi:hypothetical protein